MLASGNGLAQMGKRIGKHMFGMAGLMSALSVGTVAPAEVVAVDEVQSVKQDQSQACSTQTQTATPDAASPMPDTAANAADWIAQDQTVQIHDFESAEDALVLVWDDSDANVPEPQVHMQEDPEETGQLQVWMGDRVIAQVGGPAPLAEADLALIPLSVARDLGFAPV
ncbi:hypothetical protein JQT66_02085 [Sulfitobacter mediterraneus]|uniref:hypothetical protein n=1 Tax=Sulfitobacter mediterraneus TaxID=83219 RepID=UPI001931401A|nr:hypothetical protein [Sulfitobacter mediterraneus]MBM1308953.1 hypothetical protein [Sulfitobacter mediterraneus]MBM1312838.1 hypothetical protein [Sulfitobacter mediterraneus]MBM1321220.1 hypothetical protein [Sulfitobacter mediterraneus]MBM1325107.1 hypothetical protein [Sulfitobacter mediterraneus]MBM1396454.1 hypothetical protein [Sulfitobacter mediterraneus]